MSIDDRLTALGNQLVEVHVQLRDELDQIRAALLTATPPRDLRTHCLAFCDALTAHHTGEDGGIFPALAREFPDLVPTLELLSRDHEMITTLLGNLSALLAGLGTDPGDDQRRRVLGEVDGLSAILDSHFAYEEKRLVGALNASRLPPPATGIR